VSDSQLQKTSRTALKERGQYLLAFGVVASMLLVAGFPLFVIFFFGIFAYFLLRMFASGSRSETREVFEFYLTANEMLRDDERRWYGFELNDAIRRGEEIVHRMSPAPPLVYFALGALQNRAANHKAAINNLAYVVENEAADEASYTFASPELQNYVRVLRKIEREPADAPLTSAAVRSLERARKLRAKTLLEESRRKFAEPPVTAESPVDLEADENNVYQFQPIETVHGENRTTDPSPGKTTGSPRIVKAKHEVADPYADRKPISEVLHDIYDKNVQ
jgi:hypothetical protein